MTGLALGGLLALAIGIGISRFVYTPILPFMEDALGITKSDAGLIASANFLGYLLGALIGIRSRLPGSSRLWFLSALVTCAVTTIVMGLTDNLLFFLALRLTGGIASAFVMVFGSALVLSRLAAQGRSALAALYFAGVGGGIALSSVLIVALESADIGWRGMWIASGIVSLLLLTPVLRLVPAAREPESAASENAPLRYSRPLKALIIAYFLLGFGYIITATFISTLVRQIPDMQWMQSFVWLIVGLAAIPSVAFWSWIGARIGNSRSYALASLSLAIGVTASVLGTSAVALAFAAVLLGGTFMGMTALGLVEARNLAPNHARQILAVMTLSFGLGQTVGPGFAGYVYGFFGDFVAASLIAAAGLVLATLLMWLSAAKKPVVRAG